MIKFLLIIVLVLVVVSLNGCTKEAPPLKWSVVQCQTPTGCKRIGDYEFMSDCLGAAKYLKTDEADKTIDYGCTSNE